MTTLRTMTTKTSSPAPPARLPMVLLLFSLLLFSLVLCSPLLAQQQHRDPPQYALLYGTVFSPDGRVAPGIRILIRPANAKKPKYERTSDARGEFAQRLPTGPADYIITTDPKSPAFGKKGTFTPAPDATVHFTGNDRQDISLHLQPRQNSEQK